MAKSKRTKKKNKKSNFQKFESSKNSFSKPLNEIELDLTSLDENKRMSACNLLNEIYINSQNEIESIEPLISNSLLGKLAMRLVDYSSGVKTCASNVLKSLTESKNNKVIERVYSVGTLGSVFTLLGESSTQHVDEGILFENLIFILSNVVSTNNSALNELVSNKKELIMKLSSMIDISLCSIKVIIAILHLINELILTDAGHLVSNDIIGVSGIQFLNNYFNIAQNHIQSSQLIQEDLFQYLISQLLIIQIIFNFLMKSGDLSMNDGVLDANYFPIPTYIDFLKITSCNAHNIVMGGNESQSLPFGLDQKNFAEFSKLVLDCIRQLLLQLIHMRESSKSGQKSSIEQIFMPISKDFVPYFYDNSWITVANSVSKLCGSNQYEIALAEISKPVEEQLHLADVFSLFDSHEQQSMVLSAYLSAADVFGVANKESISGKEYFGFGPILNVLICDSKLLMAMNMENQSGKKNLKLLRDSLVSSIMNSVDSLQALVRLHIFHLEDKLLEKIISDMDIILNLPDIEVCISVVCAFGVIFSHLEEKNQNQYDLVRLHSNIMRSLLARFENPRAYSYINPFSSREFNERHSTCLLIDAILNVLIDINSSDNANYHSNYLSYQTQSKMIQKATFFQNEISSFFDSHLNEADQEKFSETLQNTDAFIHYKSENFGHFK